MSIVVGSRVRLHPARGDSLKPPFCYYAIQGREGVVLDETRDGALRIAFDPASPNARPRLMVAWESDLLPA
jgi:hypothetical protein